MRRVSYPLFAIILTIIALPAKNFNPRDLALRQTEKSNVLDSVTSRILPVQSCGVLNESGVTYRLQNDISSTDSCLNIQAENIGIDLNGHTITFATRPGGPHHYGIVGMDCNTRESDPKACGGHWQNAVIYNGSIKEDAAGSEFGYMDGIRNGPGPDWACENWAVHDLDITINQGTYAHESAPLNSRALAFTYCAQSVQIYKVTTHIGYGRVSNRYEILGPAMRLFPSTGGGYGNRPYTSPYCGATTSYTPSQEICDNTINGGTQGGIGGKTDYRHIYGNVIATNSSSTNDFAIYAWGQFGEADHNTINNPSGRGIQIAGGNGVIGPGSAQGWNIHDNNITARMLPQWCADNGAAPCNSCEGSGLFGIEYKAGDYNVHVRNNAVTVYANSCMATALRLTDTETNNLDSDNTYTALLEGTKCGPGARNSPCFANAMSLNSGGYNAAGGLAGYAPVRLQNDIFSGDDDQVYVDYGAPLGALFKNCTFIKPGTASSKHVFIRWGSYSSAAGLNIHFQDPIFKGGEDPNSNVMYPIGGGHPAEEYFIDWTYTLTVKNNSGKPLEGAMVSIADARKRQVFSGQTDSAGRISTVLNQIHWHSTTSGVTRDLNTPHQVSVSAPNCESATASVAISETANAGVQLLCH